MSGVYLFEKHRDHPEKLLYLGTRSKVTSRLSGITEQTQRDMIYIVVDLKGAKFKRHNSWCV